jgi:hypothetical protein
VLKIIRRWDFKHALFDLINLLKQYVQVRTFLISNSGVEAYACYLQVLKGFQWRKYGFNFIILETISIITNVIVFFER